MRERNVNPIGKMPHPVLYQKILFPRKRFRQILEDAEAFQRSQDMSVQNGDRITEPDIS